MTAVERRAKGADCAGAARDDARHAHQAVAVHVAVEPPRPEAARRSRARRSGRRQDRHRFRPLHLQMGDRRAYRKTGGWRRRNADDRTVDAAGSADHAGRRLRRRPHPDERLQQPPRRAVRQGRPARGPQSRLQHVRPHARAVAPLSSAAADGRPAAGHRARRQRHRDDRPLHHPQHGADVPRVRLRGGDHRLPVRLDLSRRHRRDRLALRLVHGEGVRLAHRRSAGR